MDERKRVGCGSKASVFVLVRLLPGRRESGAPELLEYLSDVALDGDRNVVIVILALLRPLRPRRDAIELPGAKNSSDAAAGASDRLAPIEGP